MDLIQSTKAPNREQPSTLDPRPSTLNPQPPTLDPRPSTLNPQPSTHNPQPSTPNPRPLTLNSRPPTLDDAQGKAVAQFWFDTKHQSSCGLIQSTKAQGKAVAPQDASANLTAEEKEMINDDPNPDRKVRDPEIQNPEVRKLPEPLEALRGGIPWSFLAPLGRSWSHFVGIHRQKLTRSLKI